MSHHTTLKSNRNLKLMARCKKLFSLINLSVEIADINGYRKSDFFSFNLLLIFAIFLFGEVILLRAITDKIITPVTIKIPSIPFPITERLNKMFSVFILNLQK